MPDDQTEQLEEIGITTVSRLSLLGLGVWGFGSHLLVT